MPPHTYVSTRCWIGDKLIFKPTKFRQNTFMGGNKNWMFALTQFDNRKDSSGPNFSLVIFTQTLLKYLVVCITNTIGCLTQRIGCLTQRIGCLKERIECLTKRIKFVIQKLIFIKKKIIIIFMLFFIFFIFFFFSKCRQI